MESTHKRNDNVDIIRPFFWWSVGRTTMYAHSLPSDFKRSVIIIEMGFRLFLASNYCPNEAPLLSFAALVLVRKLLALWTRLTLMS